MLLPLVLAASVSAAVVEEVTGLYPVVVDRVVRPRSVEEVQALLRRHRGPVSVGGGRFSMGGQTATEGALQLDMRGLDRVLAVGPGTVEAEAGATWRKLQEELDPRGLSLKIMQSYANFTVGGSLSVNVHGRYVNQGPLIRAVRSFKLVLPDGRLVECSRTRNRDLFYGVIGGYGGLGVIVSAVLEVERNEPVERAAVPMPVSEYPAWFAANVRGSTSAVFHNADIYPPDYGSVMAVTYSRTDRPVTVPERLQPARRPRLRDRLLLWWLSERAYAKRLRASVLDPVRLKARPVSWRNHEASYDVAELEPYSRERTTYVLQEYFIPPDRFGDFVPRMAEIFRRHGANVLNVSIRHALPDDGSLLAWAPGERFAFVVYYKQGTSRHERTHVGVWTRELIDAALACGGSYYLPYQWHATDEQFHRAYPRAKEWFALKKRVDPSYKLRNKLWDRYFPPPAPAEPEWKAQWRRPEEQTYLTLPEWFIVFSAADYAAWLEAGRSPASFPYFRSIGQFWSMAWAVRRWLPRNPGYAVMIGVIGASFTAEYAAKAGAEALLSWTKPDPALAAIARDYAAFLPDTPWYLFPYNAKRLELTGPWTLRRAAAKAELALKAAWAWTIRKATGAAYSPDEPTLRAVVDGAVVELPRYRRFQEAAAALAAEGKRFSSIAGNKRILVTVVVPGAWDEARLWGDELGSWTLPTDPSRKRVAISLPVDQLSNAVRELRIEHAYDY